MEFIKTEIKDVFIIEPTVFSDNRGYFFEAYNEQVFQENGVILKFVQDNQSQSSYGVIRGLHYQIAPYSQSKLIRVLEGAILDVAVDIRMGSPTYGKHVAIELTAENKKQLLVPSGFAHGFSVLSNIAVVHYKCDQFYYRESEAGILYNDPELKIDWKIKAGEEIVSEKDLLLPSFAECKNNFEFTG